MDNPKTAGLTTGFRCSSNVAQASRLSSNKQHSQDDRVTFEKIPETKIGANYMEHLLSIKNLHIKFRSHDKVFNAVNGISLNLAKGETLGIVGESGAGKSVTFYSLLGLLPKGKTEITSGEAIFNSKDLIKLPDKELLKIKGKEISIIFQDPMTSLNPYLKVGNQIIEALRTHYKVSKKDARQETLKILKEVGINEPERRFEQYPHEFSGGMRQRIMISMALITKPKLLIADEPTTALDVTVQAQILNLLRDLKEKYSMSIIFITHDLGIVAEMCDNVCIMYAGSVVEYGSVRDIFYNSKHPYTISLKKSVPNLHDKQETLYSIPGIPPDISKPISGCPFAPRCFMAKDKCFNTNIKLIELDKNHLSSCLYAKDI